MTNINKLRFRLSTLVILVLLIGAVIHLVFNATSWRRIEALQNDFPSTWNAQKSGRVRVGWEDGQDHGELYVDGRYIATMFHNDNLECYAASPDFSRVVTGSDDNTAKIWRTLDGELLAILHTAGPVMHAEFINDSTLALYEGYEKKTVSTWERRRPEPWWGLAWLPSFWVVVALAALLVWKIVKNVTGANHVAVNK